MQVYFLSGLGADKTVFQFLDLSYCDPVFIDWIPPINNESLQDYALRLKQAFIPDDAVVVGLSFGGMLATEIAKANKNIRSVLISSAKTRFEIPAYYKTGKMLPLHNMLPGAVHRWFMLRIKWLLGVKNEPSLQVYKELIAKSDFNFNAWAVNALLRGENTSVPENITHIHGKHEKILAYRYV